MKLLYLVESGESKFLVFDEMPDKISTKYGDDTIIGRIGGIFYDFLAKRNERREAFGGRKFDIVLGGTNCSGSNMDWLFGCLGNENFYVCQPVSFYKSQQEIQKVNPLYAFKVATAYFREQGKVPVFEDCHCRLMKI